jgi:hypothetical protein
MTRKHDKQLDVGYNEALEPLPYVTVCHRCDAMDESFESCFQLSLDPGTLDTSNVMGETAILTYG